MKDCVNAYLNARGYSVNTKALEVIKSCDDWYANRTIDHFHKRRNLNGVEIRLEQMNMAKRCCADDANLCEVISVKPDEHAKSVAFIEELLTRNRFDVMYREQLEKTSAAGTSGGYIYLQNADFMEDANGAVRVSGGEVCINYCDADCIIPLTVENKQVTECAFGVTNTVKGKERTTLTIFTRENMNYIAETIMFDEYGSTLDDSYIRLQLGEVKPFAIMTVAEVNNLDNMSGYGLPKIYNAIPMLKAVDLCYSLLYGDLAKGDKLVFINELLSCITMSEEGIPTLTPQQKEIFILLGQKLPDQESVIKEYNPEIRVEEITKAFELVLSLLSMSFGYGTKKYKFEQGQITTATEYIGEKQEELQELNRQRKQAVAYITDLVHAAEWFSNAFSGTAFDCTEELIVEFDDSYIEDKAAKLEAMRADALSFPEVMEFKIRYIMDRLMVPREEAEKMITGMEAEEERED